MADTSPPTRRRWFQFGLGTMLIVLTILAVWLGREVNLVRERQAMRKWLKSNDWGTDTTVKYADEFFSWDLTDTVWVPTWRKWLGDEPVVLIAIPNGSKQSDEEAVRRLFPEAIVAPVADFAVPATK